MDLFQRLQHLQLGLDLLLAVQHEVRHAHEAKVVGDLGVEAPAQPADLRIVLVGLADLLHEAFEDLVALEDAGLGEFAQRHLLGVVADLLHLAGHHLHVEDEPDELLHRRLQPRLRLLLLALITLLASRRLLHRCVLLVVHLDERVGLALVVELLVEFLEGSLEGLGLLLRLLPLHPHSSPPREDHKLVGLALVLQHLDYVELVVVLLDVALVERGCVDPFLVRQHLEATTSREVLVHWNCPLQNQLLQLLLLQLLASLFTRLLLPPFLLLTALTSTL